MRDSVPPPTAPGGHSAWWLATGAGLVGVLFGGAAVYLGVAEHRAPASVPAAPATVSPEPTPVLPEPEVQPEPTAVTVPIDEVQPTLIDAVARTRDAVVSIGAAGTLGAGVIVDAEGTIITNHHVIADALLAPRRGLLDGVESDRPRTPDRPTVRARFEDGRELSALVVVADAEQDLAILRLIGDDDERFSAVALGESGEVQVGVEVFAIGNPFGLSHTVSRGIVSATDRTHVLDNRVPLLQLDASINVGNSGGPLFDLQGRLLGIVTAKRRDAQGIAFAVPVDHLRGFLRAVADPTSARSGAIGVAVAGAGDLPQAVSELGYRAGLSIDKVEEGSPAQTAGLRVGDVLVEVRGKRLDGLPEAGDPRALGQQFAESVRSMFAGETLDVSYVRDQAVESVSIEVGAAPPERQAEIDAEELLGLRLTKPEGAGLPAIGQVLDTSPFFVRADLLVGGRVVTLMNRRVRTTEDLGTELSRVRALVRQHGSVEVLVGFAHADGRLLGEAHVVVG